jgi:hypothetical protein
MLFSSIGGDTDNWLDSIARLKTGRCSLELFWLFGGTNPIFEPSMPPQLLLSLDFQWILI